MAARVDPRRRQARQITRQRGDGHPSARRWGTGRRQEIDPMLKRLKFLVLPGALLLSIAGPVKSPDPR